MSRRARICRSSRAGAPSSPPAATAARHDHDRARPHFGWRMMPESDLADTTATEVAVPPEREPRPSWVDDPRMRRAANTVAALLFFYWLLERLWPAPAGVILKGMVIGGLYSLVALGLALVYRANRIINFAQGDLGGTPAALGVLLIVSVGVP